jgi:hemoglobin
MRKTMACVVLATFCLSATTLLSAPLPQADQQQSLYKRLGGFDALAAVTDDFIGRMTVNPQLKRFFTGFNQGSLTRIREHIVDFLCQTTGGPCKYHGEDMKTAHTGLKITDADWDAAVKDLNATFDKFKVPQKERGEVLTAITGLKGDIVGQ